MLSNEGVDMSGISIRRNGRAGRAYMVVLPSENLAMVDPSPNSELSRDDVTSALPGGDVLLVSLEVPYYAVRAALERFRGFKTLNPTPAFIGTKDLLALADIATPIQTRWRPSADKVKNRPRPSRRGGGQRDPAPKVNACGVTGACDSF
ncbi:MAG: hypothetical protein ACP5HK_00060, partial [Acidilobus sp.]